MTGLPKRTALRSSPEDEAHYRQFHDAVLARRQAGIPREEILKDLTGSGVPEKTAERIVFAVEQELEHSAFSSQVTRKVSWIRTGGIGLFIFLVAAYAAWQMGEHRRIPLRVALPGLFIAITAMTFVFGRFSRKMKPPLGPPSPS